MNVDTVDRKGLFLFRDEHGHLPGDGEFLETIEKVTHGRGTSAYLICSSIVEF